MAELEKGNSWNINSVVNGLSGDLESLYETLLQKLLDEIGHGKDVFHKTLAMTVAAL